MTHKHGSDEYGTPQALFDLLDREFDFELDVAASHKNHKVEWYYTQEMDALQKDWRIDVNNPARCFCNPPYSKPNIPRFVEKAIEESKKGSLVVMILPDDTGTIWYQDLVQPFAMEVRKLRGRLRFEGATQSAKFATIVAIFAPCVRSHIGPREWCWDWKSERAALEQEAHHDRGNWHYAKPCKSRGQPPPPQRGGVKGEMK